MKRKTSLLIMAALCFLLGSSVQGQTVGIQFSMSDAFSVGTRIHISEFYAIQPSVGFFVGEDVSSTFALGIGNLFYLLETQDIEHYLGVDLFLLLTEPENSVELAGYYGLQYPIAEVFHVYGELGLFLNLQPATALSTFKTGVGVIFYPW